MDVAILQARFVFCSLFFVFLAHFLYPTDIAFASEGAQTASPTAIIIPGIALEAPVIDVSYLPETGAMEVPANGHEVGWYKHGPTPGVRGASVLAGHYTYPEREPAIFYYLNQVSVGEFSLFAMMMVLYSSM